MDGTMRGCNNGALSNWAVTVAYYNGLDFAAKTDWRLPNVKELVSITEYDAALRTAGLPMIQEPPFSNTFLSPYWSSTTYTVNVAEALQVNFIAGTVQNINKTLTRRSRGVRGGL